MRKNYPRKSRHLSGSRSKHPKTYRPWEIESRWQKVWAKKPLYKAKDFAKKKKFYALVEFPYPSGEGLHMGHAFTCTIMDVFARKKRMDGYNVLHPMGWDAFGLPTENYAIQTGIHPAVATKQNTDQFRTQMKGLALTYDWEREIDTTNPSYYKWTQWIFTQLFKHGLAYKAETPVGWCPACKIVLANEEIVNDRCERCGHEAERRMQKQWLLRITAYADRLADELGLVDYPDYVKAAQRNWIGRSEGAEVEFRVSGDRFNQAKRSTKRSDPPSEAIKVFTTRPDTLFGVTAVVLAPEHWLVALLLRGEHLGWWRSNDFDSSEVEKKRRKIKKYVKQAKKKSELERTELQKKKTGVFTGLYCINPINNESVPIWIGDYVVATYGGGAVMVVPAHDQRDFEFAKKYNLPIKMVIKPQTPRTVVAKSTSSEVKEVKKKAFEDYGILVNSGKYNGLHSKEAIAKITENLEKQGLGRKAVSYHLRDWIFSRQHYWGEPIPMIYCPKCAKKGITWWETEEGKKLKPLFNPEVSRVFNLGGCPDRQPRELAGWFPLKEDELALELPKVEKYQPTETGESPLANIKNWVKTQCLHCGGPAKRETDTMPNWAGSSWYFLRYCDTENNSCLADKKKLKYWLPVDLYLGGAEHTTLHLLYSRFWHKFLNDIGVAPGKEPYAARRQHGVILGADGYRMSKSRGNIINPEEVIEKFGIDTLRVYLMFMGPYDVTMPWSAKGVEGCYRFLNRIWRIYHSSDPGSEQTYDPGSSLIRQLHRLIKKVGEDIEALKLNTAIAAMMEFLNSWQKNSSSELQFALSQKDVSIFLRLLAPFAPHLAEELWQRLFTKDSPLQERTVLNRWSIHQQPWPQYDPKLIKEEMVTIVIQVNGKVRGQINIKYQISNIKNEVEKLAKKEENVARHLRGEKIKKAIFVPGRLINFVV